MNYDKNSNRDTISSYVLVWLQIPDSSLLRLPLHDYQPYHVFNVNLHGHFIRNSLSTSDDQGIVAGVILIMFNDAGYNIKLSALCYQLK